MLFQIIALFFIVKTTLAVEQAASEVNCPQSSVQTRYSSGACSAPVESIFSTVPESLPLLLPQQNRPAAEKKVPQATISTVKRPELAKQKTIIYFFWGKGCPHCEEERQFLDDG